MRDTTNGKVIINSDDLGSWCNCHNFPFQKCDGCFGKLGTLTHLKDGEEYILR